MVAVHSAIKAADDAPELGQLSYPHVLRMPSEGAIISIVNSVPGAEEFYEDL